ncbi:hypothetical protein X975_01492, partial [Stegodyphus mimosarum]
MTSSMTNNETVCDNSCRKCRREMEASGTCGPSADWKGEKDNHGAEGVRTMLGSSAGESGRLKSCELCQQVLSLRAMGPQFLFMDDNAPPHRTVTVEELLESEDIEHMDWSARSLDLNPVKHVRNLLGRPVAARNLSPVTIPKLRLVLQEERAAVSQQLINNHISSMHK